MQLSKHPSNNQNILSALTKVKSVDNLHSKRMQKPLYHPSHTKDHSVQNHKPALTDRKFPILAHCRSGSNILKQYEVARQNLYNDEPIFSVKSFDSNGSFQKVIKHYKLENQNLKKQNKYLIVQLKELKRRQEINQHQLQRMQYLEQRLQKLELKNTNEFKGDFRYNQMTSNGAQRCSSKKQIYNCDVNCNNKQNNFTLTNQKRNNFNANFINEDVSIQSTPRNNQKTLRIYNSPGKDTYYNKFYGQEIRKQPNFSQQPHVFKQVNIKNSSGNDDPTIYFNCKCAKQETNLTFESSTADDIKEKISDLNNEFNYLIEQCAKEKNGLRKLDLRRSLAIVAKQMKTLKAQFQKNQKRDF